MRTSTTRRWPVRYLWLGTLAVVATLLQPASTAAAGRSIGQAGAQAAANAIHRPQGITAGPDGALWFTNYDNSSIGRITPGGKVSSFTDKGISRPYGITTGPDGALWFTNGTHAIGRITTSGKIKSFSRKGVIVSPPPDGITSGPDGALWFTNYYDDSVARITTAGVVTRF